MQCPTYKAEALEKLSGILGIPELGSEDWDLICADSHRVDEFCNVYETGSLEADCKVALMQFIAASYADYLSEAAPGAELEQRVTDLLTKDFELHRHTNA